MAENCYLKIDQGMKLSDLADLIGDSYVPAVLNLNGIDRCVNIGDKYYSQCETIAKNSSAVPYKRKEELLNKFATDSDVFDYATIQDESGWKVLSNKLAFPDAIKIPTYIDLPKNDNLLGDGIPVAKKVYKNALLQLKTTGNTVNSLNEYSSAKQVKKKESITNRDTNSNLFHHFKIPWGEILFYSSLADTYVEIPVYPSDPKEERTASYDQMDILYAYEPMISYNSAGARTASLSFSDIHRQLWSGDELDGEANKMIRFIQSSLYPRYTGSNVHSDTVTLYISGKPYITGVLTGCSISWKGPLGRDSMPLAFDMTLDIQEVSQIPLNNDSVKRLPLIGY